MVICLAQVLTQKQIDELLGNLQSGAVDLEKVEAQNPKKVKEYDFRAPKKFSREQLKMLNNIYDNFARLFGLHLSSMLRVSCEFETLQVEEQEYREFNNALNDSVLVGVIGLNNEEFDLDGKRIIVEIARPLSFAILDLLFGGEGKGFNIEREYTEIELSLMEYLLKQLIQQMQNAWVNYGEIKHKLEMIETNSRLIQFIPPDEAVVIIIMEMKVMDLSGTVNVCLPASALEGIFKMFDAKFSQTYRKVNVENATAVKEQMIDTLKESSLTVTGILGQSEITLRELLELKPGDVIPLQSLSNADSIKVNVEDVPWFYGSLGKKKKNYAIKVSSTVH